jgi:hypothetical protein
MILARALIINLLALYATLVPQEAPRPFGRLRKDVGVFQLQPSFGAGPITIPNVKQAFERVLARPSQLMVFRNRRLLSQMPSGFNESMRYHQQGVQAAPGGGFVVSGSTREGSASYFYITDSAGQVINVTTIERGAYSHAGGIQVYGAILAVGVENPSNKRGGSRVYFYDLSNPRLPRRLPLVITRPIETAGAVGLTQSDSGYLCVVGNYDSERLDFYRFRDLNRADGGGIMNTGRTVGGGDWHSYQNINLFTGADRSVWLIGMHTSGVMREDWADLFRVTFSNNDTQFRISKEGKKHHICSTQGSRFVYGSGYSWNAARQKFEAYSVEDRMNGEGTTRGASWSR